MRYGIDFGTTRTVVACADRGNYPVVPVFDAGGDAHHYMPSLVALVDGELRTGWDAVGIPGVRRSIKRMLADPRVTAETPVSFGDESRPLCDVLAAMASDALVGLDDPEIVLGVPANSSSAQRLLTLDAFTRAGANVVGLVNEPSAAAFEYTHGYGRTFNSKRNSIIVYDLGGGTFDATYLRIDNGHHEVIDSSGISLLGGDDFDLVLASLADVTVDEARVAKEAIKPQSRRVMIEHDDGVVTIPVADYYEAAKPLVARSLEAVDKLATGDDVAGIYLVGGATSLPLIPRQLKERFGRRVHRSPLPTASTAVGLAIAADPDSGYTLAERTTRGIGVFRENEGGSQISFDTLLEPGVGEVTRTYHAAHNVGWFRYVEYGEGEDIRPVVEVVVPFQAGIDDPRNEPVHRVDNGPLVEETAWIDESGIARVRITVASLGVVVEATAR